MTTAPGDDGAPLDDGARARARAAVARLCRRTPFVRAEGLGVWLKLEHLQRTGSFKLRGAAARLGDLGDARGVVTASAGNHGLGVALAARALGVTAEVFVPALAPEVKRAGIRALGAELVVAGAVYAEAEAAALERARRAGLPFVSPFDDEHVLFGNGGTLGEELLSDAAGRGLELARVVVPVGGGGLVAGLAEALAPRGVAVWGIEPAQNAAMAASAAEGRARTDFPEGGETLAEALEGGVAARTFARVVRHGVRLAQVPEAGLRRWVARAYRELGLAIEPSSAAALAALEVAPELRASGTVVVLTGGNVEPELLDALLAEELSRARREG